jgi:DNA-binding response OmpR family regulator
MAHKPHCLIVEDQALIAMGLEAYLEDEGCRAVTCESSAEALRWLKTNTPTCVILDYALRDETCLNLARELKSRRVPFLVYSGHPPKTDLPELDNVPWLEKPVSRDALMGVLSAVTAWSIRPSSSA